MSAPRHITRCLRCGEWLYEKRNLTNDGNNIYRLKCHSCDQYIEIKANAYDEAFDLFRAMFAGQIFFSIEDLTEDDGVVLGYRLPVEEPPDIICVLDTEYDESKYTHFSYLPLIRWIEKDGKIKPFKYWGDDDE